ncbi:CRISPR-associated endoribonuclease Cas6 [bacterium]|nr:CRISPR-associated endoribonuclease Cas6 [bacterium]
MRIIVELKPEADQNLLHVDIQFLMPKTIKYILSKSSVSEEISNSWSSFANYNLKFNPKPRVYNDQLIVGDKNILTLTVSSYSKEFIEYFNEGVLQLKTLLIQNRKFQIINVEVIDNPDIDSVQTKVYPMSPMLSGKIMENQKTPFYYKWNQPDFLIELENELKDRYKETFKKDIPENGVSIKFDQNYLKYHNDISQLVTVNKRKQRAVWAPLYISGDKELINFAIDTGLGLNREIGYGMMEIRAPKTVVVVEKKPRKPRVDELPDNFGNLIEYQNNQDSENKDSDQ